MVRASLWSQHASGKPMYQRRCPSQRPLYHLSKFGEPLFSLLCPKLRLLLQLFWRTLLCLGPNLPKRPMRNTVYGGRRQLYGEHLLLPRSVLQRHLLFLGSNLSQ
jgi:hypothetical protein